MGGERERSDGINERKVDGFGGRGLVGGEGLECFLGEMKV